MADVIIRGDVTPDKPSHVPNTIDNYGGIPEQTRGFEVREKPEGNQPQGGGSWNNDMDNPLGPK